MRQRNKVSILYNSNKQFCSLYLYGILDDLKVSQIQKSGLIGILTEVLKVPTDHETVKDMSSS